METPNPSNWSNLPLDITISLFERLSFVDFHRAKKVCSNWYSCSKQTVPQLSGCPWLMLFPDDGGCVLYNPYEDMVCKIVGDFSESRFLASCGKWFLMLDSKSRLYIIDVFKGDRIDLPPLESLVSKICTLKRLGDRKFGWELYGREVVLYADEIRGRLWVDEQTDELAVAWFFDGLAFFVCFYKKGNDRYDAVSLKHGIPRMLDGLLSLVLRGYRLYILTFRFQVRVIDFSGQQGFQELTGTKPTQSFTLIGDNCNFTIAVKSTGEVLFVTMTRSEKSETERPFRVYKKHPLASPGEFMPELLEVDCLGEEVLLLDLGIIVPADHTLGIKQNSIYFTCYDHIRTWLNEGDPFLYPYQVDM